MFALYLLCFVALCNLTSVDCKQLRGDGCVASNKTLSTIGCMLCTAQVKSVNMIEKRRTLTEVNDKFQEIYNKEVRKLVIDER